MKNSMAIGLLALLLSACVCKLQAQQNTKDLTAQFERGDISEIKDKRRVSVIADWPIQADNIVKALKKYHGLQVVSDLKEAEFVIAYRVTREKYRVSVREAGAPPPVDMEAFGLMLVYIPQESGKPRLVWETRQRYQLPHRGQIYGKPAWEQALEKSVTTKFIKVLKTTRGEK